MTSNQINYWVNEERKRTDLANESVKQGELSETRRSNLINENTARQNAITNRTGMTWNNLNSTAKLLLDTIKPDAGLAKVLVSLLAG